MLIEGRGDFRDEDGVVLLGDWLTLHGIEGMDGMSRFMGKGEDILESAFIVKKDIRMDVGTTAGIGTATLAWGSIDIDIAFAGRFSCFLLIILWVAFDGFIEEFESFLIAIFLLGLGKLDETVIGTEFLES